MYSNEDLIADITKPSVYNIPELQEELRRHKLDKENNYIGRIWCGIVNRGFKKDLVFLPLQKIEVSAIIAINVDGEDSILLLEQIIEKITNAGSKSLEPYSLTTPSTVMKPGEFPRDIARCVVQKMCVINVAFPNCGVSVILAETDDDLSNGKAHCCFWLLVFLESGPLPKLALINFPYLLMGPKEVSRRAAHNNNENDENDYNEMPESQAARAEREHGAAIAGILQQQVAQLAQLLHAGFIDRQNERLDRQNERQLLAAYLRQHAGGRADQQAGGRPRPRLPQGCHQTPCGGGLHNGIARIRAKSPPKQSTILDAEVKIVKSCERKVYRAGDYVESWGWIAPGPRDRNTNNPFAFLCEYISHWVE
ncbi:hypothetical protein B7494_g5707 [Chlorociboria aeruginascens]|nr:hypothetical protein B7494_g5707 [Chlorociboria aeruginascens]